MKKYVIVVIASIFVYVLLLGFFINYTPAFYDKGCFKINSFWNRINCIDSNNASALGSLLSGVIGSLLAGISIVVLLINIKDSNDKVVKNDYEHRFFELLRLHRENCAALYIESRNHKEIKNKKVFMLILREYIYLYEYLVKNYQEKFNFQNTDREIRTVFLIIYYGTGPRSRQQLKSSLKKNNLCSDDETELLISKLKTLYDNDKKSEKNKSLKEDRMFVEYTPAGGHDMRLQEYFYLFVYILNFIKNNPFTKESEKNEAVKLLATQISLPELLIIFLSSIQVNEQLKKLIIEYKKFFLNYDSEYFESFYLAIPEIDNNKVKFKEFITKNLK